MLNQGERVCLVLWTIRRMSGRLHSPAHAHAHGISNLTWSSVIIILKLSKLTTRARSLMKIAQGYGVAICNNAIFVNAHQLFRLSETAATPFRHSKAYWQSLLCKPRHKADEPRWSVRSSSP